MCTLFSVVSYTWIRLYFITNQFYVANSAIYLYTGNIVWVQLNYETYMYLIFKIAIHAFKTKAIIL